MSEGGAGFSQPMAWCRRRIENLAKISVRGARNIVASLELITIATTGNATMSVVNKIEHVVVMLDNRSAWGHFILSLS